MHIVQKCGRNMPVRETVTEKYSFGVTAQNSQRKRKYSQPDLQASMNPRNGCDFSINQ